jgi:predicted anti-sigma-YlaC factor YlaD
MECIECREALSARIDGEYEQVSAELVDRHLRACGACARWQERATQVTRTLRVGLATPTPDLTDAVLAAAGAGRSGRRRPPSRPALPPGSPRRAARARHQTGSWLVTARLALAAVGWAQLGLGLLQLGDGLREPAHATGAGAHVGAAHLFNESVAWNIAIAVGMLWAAAQTRRAGGLFAALSGAVVVLTALSVHDLLTQAVGVTRVASHVLLLVGLGLVYLVDRGHQTGTPGPGRLQSRHLEPARTPGRRPDPATAAIREGGSGLPRTASHHHAA